MSQPVREDAFVVRAIPYAERDVIATLYGASLGLVSAIAKNARNARRFAGGIAPFRKLSATLQRRAPRAMDLFVEMKVTASYPNLEASFDKIAVGSYGTELLRELARGDDEPGSLFGLLSSFYDRLDALPDEPASLEALAHHFALRLLRHAGAAPALSGCQRCERAPADFDRLQCKRSGEGLLCAACRRPGEAVGVIEEAALGLLQYYDAPGEERPEELGDEATRAQARRVVEASIDAALGRELKSRALARQVFEGER